MYIFFSLFSSIISLILIFLIICQRGSGAHVSNNFYFGASETLFGSSGSEKFIVKLTIVFAILFFLSLLILGILNSSKTFDLKEKISVIEDFNN